jgi:hypothetical protein
MDNHSGHYSKNSSILLLWDDGIDGYAMDYVEKLLYIVRRNKKMNLINDCSITCKSASGRLIIE